MPNHSLKPLKPNLKRQSITVTLTETQAVMLQRRAIAEQGEFYGPEPEAHIMKQIYRKAQTLFPDIKESNRQAELAMQILAKNYRSPETDAINAKHQEDHDILMGRLTEARDAMERFENQVREEISESIKVQFQAAGITRFEPSPGHAGLFLKNPEPVAEKPPKATQDTLPRRRKGGSMKIIHFNDDGQDFLRWAVDKDGIVTDSQPYQAGVWGGTKIENIESLKPGDNPMITNQHHPSPVPLIHTVKEIEEVGDD